MFTGMTKTGHTKEKMMEAKDIINSIPIYPATITGRELADALGLTSSADVRKNVNALRTAGYPIVSTKDGYSVATDAKQIEDCIRSLRSRVASIESAIAGLYRSFGAVAQ